MSALAKGQERSDDSRVMTSSPGRSLGSSLVIMWEGMGIGRETKEVEIVTRGKLKGREIGSGGEINVEYWYQRGTNIKGRLICTGDKVKEEQSNRYRDKEGTNRNSEKLPNIRYMKVIGKRRM